MKKLLTLILAFMATTATLFASSGTCGENVTWDLTDGVLTISGTGPMNNFTISTIPWNGERASIVSIIIEDGVTTIGNYAFLYCDGLTSVMIGNSVTSIGVSAFYDCDGLTSVTIPNSVTSIGQSAFCQCYGLTSVTIGNSVTSIGDQAFMNCFSLTSVTIPNSVTSIGNEAFYGCGSLTSFNVASENSNYSSLDGVLFNKDKTILIQYPAHKEGAYTIPNSVTNIGKSAFIYCDGLTSVMIGNSVTNIGESAFSYCTGLTSVTIGNSVTSIGWSAFASCEGLTKITCEATTPPTLEDQVFEYVPKSIPVYVPKESVDAYKATSGWNYFTNIKGASSGSCGENVNWDLTDGVLTISGTGPMNNFTISTIPWNGERASIVSIIIEDGVTTIGNYAFLYCDGLTSVMIGNSVTSIGVSAFYDCDGLTSVTIPNSVTSIGQSAFCQCYGLTSVTIGNSVTSIGDQAFMNCFSLTSVTIPNSVTSIGNEAFYGCGSLTSFNVASENSNYSSLDGVLFNKDKTILIQYPAHKEGAYTIPNSVTNIGKSAFIYCDGLTSVMIGNSVTNIGESAFSYCTGLTSVTIGNSVTSIGWSAFASCEGLTKITCEATTPPTLEDQVFEYVPKSIPVYVPAESVELYKAADGWKEMNIKAEGEPVWDWDLTDGVLTISGTGPMTDYGSFTAVPWYSVQESITSVVIEDGITRIGNSAFKYCSNVASVAIPNSVISIGEYAFDDCGMSSIIIPNNVETIEDYAFSNCYNLSTVTIGSGVKSIGQLAFADDEALAVVTCNAMTPPTLGYEVFYSVPSSCVIYVPAESVELYKAADGWKEMNISKPAEEIVIDLINAIGSPITLESEPAIVAARSAYDALTDAQKARVSNYATLSAAEAKLDQLKKQAAADQAAADLVIGKINAIGTVSYTTASKALIDAARGAYDALTDAQKALVTNYATLTAAEKAYAELKAQAEADQAAANVVIGQIDAIGEVTLASEPAIVAARGAYDALTDAQKALVTNYATLTAAEAKLEILKKQAESDEAAAAAVTDLINGIGAISYTTESKALIDAARTAYDALTDAQKALVTNLSTLTAAEQVYEQLKAEAEADQKAANVVIDLIDQIGEVTLASEPAINAARTAYNSLTSIQQELVTNYGTLLAAETTLELLKQQATIDQAMADDVIARIEAIGEVTYTNNCYSRIFDARAAYDALSDVQKALVTNYATLTAAEARYAELEAQAKAVEEAKTQLKALVSEAAELKAVAMLYSPASVEQIDAIIANAQQTIDDPNATVEDVNAKTEIIRGEIQFAGAALLEEAKEQLRQSIKALYQSGDYPSWYAAVIIPALNQVDEIMWDNDKTVQENILIFQTTGKAIYDTAKAALEALRASDKREIVSACEFTGFNGAITDGMMWNEAALNALVANLNASAATQPYHFNAEECMLTKWDAENELFVGVDHNEGVVLTPGDYQFVANISIDGEAAAQYRFPKATEATLSVTVDAAVWSVDLSGIVIDANYSFTYVTSPMFTISKSEDVELVNEDPIKTQKIYHNGHFYILRGEHIYDLRGTLVR